MTSPTADPPTNEGIDWDRLLTLLLCVSVVVSTLGLVLLPQLVRVYRVARKAPIAAPLAEIHLVFGKRLIDGKVDNEYRARLWRALLLAREDPERITILLGGAASQGDMTEAEAGLASLQSLGWPQRAPIILEQRSRNTLENLRNAQRLGFSPKQRRAALISNRYHLARCSHIARVLGISHCVCAAEERWCLDRCNARKLVAEAFFLFWYRLAANWARITANPRLLRRLT